MKATSYRLAHYNIIVNIDGSLWWESYAGFARAQSGRCFIESNVLFFEPAIDVSEPGFLIMEYNEALDKLPPWTKTSYYCTHYTLRSCHNDKIQDKEGINKGLKKWTEKVTIASEGSKTGFDMDKNIESGEIIASIYQLGRYKIIEAESGNLRWNTCTHLNRLKVGRGFIKGKILFVNGKIIEESEFSKREFFKRLNQFPKWGKTPYYCTNYTLKPCQKINPSAAGKQYGSSLKAHFRYVRKSIITARKTHSNKVFKKIAEIIRGITSYKNRFL